MPDYTTGQDLEREWRTFVDQHERIWGAGSSKKTGRPCDLLQPQFSAPLEVPHEHIQVDRMDSRLVRIDYDSWIADIERSHQNWKDLIQKWAIDLGIQGTVQAVIDDPPPQILLLVGEEPTRSTTPVLAAKAGNRWVLGLSTVVPEKAKEFFPELFKAPPEAYALADPFAPEEPTPDPFAPDDEKEEATEAPADEKTNGVATELEDGYWLVDGNRFPHWASPKDGWRLSSWDLVPRDGLEKDAYRALAQEKERALHVQE